MSAWKCLRHKAFRPITLNHRGVTNASCQNCKKPSQDHRQESRRTCSGETRSREEGRRTREESRCAEGRHQESGCLAIQFPMMKRRGFPAFFYARKL